MTLFETGPSYVVSFREHRRSVKWYITSLTGRDYDCDANRDTALRCTKPEAEAAAARARKSSTGYVFTVEEV